MKIDPPPLNWSTLKYVFGRGGGPRCGRSANRPEEIVAKLRQVDVETSQGKPVAEAVRAIGVTEVTYYRSRQEFGGLKSGQVKKLKDLEAENDLGEGQPFRLAPQVPRMQLWLHDRRKEWAAMLGDFSSPSQHLLGRHTCCAS